MRTPVVARRAAVAAAVAVVVPNREGNVLEGHVLEVREKVMDVAAMLVQQIVGRPVRSW